LTAGRFEKYNIVRNRLHYYNSVGVTARYHLKHEDAETLDLQDTVFAALKPVIAAHPALGVTIANEHSPDPSFMRLETIDLSRIVRFTDETVILETIEDDHQNPFESETLPLWRIVVSRPAHDSMYVCFFVHHGICDGTSGLAFHRTFQATLNDVLSNPPVSASSLVDVPVQDMIPPVEAFPLPISLCFMGREFIQALRGHDDPKCWRGAPVFATPNHTCLRLLTLTNAQMTLINQTCHGAGVSFTALLTVLVARSLAKCIPDYPRFNCTTAMSFRRFTNTDQNAMVNYVSSFTHRFSAAGGSGRVPCGEFSWDAVRKCNAEIKAATSSPRNHRVGLLRFVSKYDGYFLGQVGHQREYSFQISNLGVVDVPKDGAAGIDKIIFTQSSSVTGSALVYSVASVKDGDVIIATTWQKGVVEYDLEERVRETLEMELDSFANSRLN
jgi:hypothetical protein